MDTSNVPNSSVTAYRIFIPLIAISLIAVAVVAALLLWPYKTAEINGPIVITNEPVPAGTVAYYEVDQCRYTDALAITTRRLVSVPGEVPAIPDNDSQQLYVPLASSETRAPTGCYTFSPPPVLIPLDTLPGKYYIEFEIHYEVNPIRSVVVKVQSEPFMVAEPRE